MPCSRCPTLASCRKLGSPRCNCDTDYCSGKRPRSRRDRRGSSAAAGMARLDSRWRYWAVFRIVAIGWNSPPYGCTFRGSGSRSYLRRKTAARRNGSRWWKRRPADGCWRSCLWSPGGCSADSSDGAGRGFRTAAAAGSAAPGSGIWARRFGSPGFRTRWRGWRCVLVSSAGISLPRFCFVRAVFVFFLRLRALTEMTNDVVNDVFITIDFCYATLV